MGDIAKVTVSEAELVVQIYDLKEAQASMNKFGLYYGIANNQIIELNIQLRGISGRNYPSYSKEEIKNMVIEVGLSLRESI